MIEPVITVDARHIATFFAVAGDKAPLAISVALNRTAEWMTKAARDLTRRAVTVRSETALRFAFPVTLPSKLRATPAALRAIIEPERIGKIFTPFVEGEIHRADFLGRMPAIPSTGFLGLRVTEKSVIPRSLYPVNLGLQPLRDARSSRIYYALGRGSIRQGRSPYRQTASGKVQLQGKRGTFQVRGRRGPVILQRFGPGRRDTRALWFLRASVPRPPVLGEAAPGGQGIFETMQTTFDEHWPTEMHAALEWVLSLRE